MVSSRVLSRLVAAAMFAGLLAAACSNADGEPTPTVEPTVTESVVESPSSPEPTTPAPGPTPWPEPTRPAAMERDDIEGAKAAAEYFLALHSYVYASGDLEEWQKVSHPECEFCHGAERYVSELYGSGGFSIGGDFTTEKIDALPPDAEFEHYRVRVAGAEGPSSSYASDGDELRTLQGGDVSYLMALLRSDGDWLLRGVAVEES